MAKRSPKVLAEIANSQIQIIEKKERNGNSGRYALYSPELLPQVEQLCRQGLTNKEIAKSIGIGEKTFYDWMNRYKQFSHSIKKYRGIADIQVENALFKSAIGFTYKEEAVTNRGSVVEVKKKQAPNVTAQIFYLKNRMPDRYKDKVETEITLGEDISSVAFVLKRRGE